MTLSSRHSTNATNFPEYHFDLSSPCPVIHGKAVIKVREDLLMYNFSNSLLRNILKFQNVEISHTRCFYFVSKNVKYSKLLKTCHHQKLKTYNVRGLQNSIKSRFICYNFLSRVLNNRLKLFAVFLEELSQTICISVMILKTA